MQNHLTTLSNRLNSNITPLPLVTDTDDQAAAYVDITNLGSDQSEVKVKFKDKDGDRTDMIAARESPGFSDYVRRIWADLDVVQ